MESSAVIETMGQATRNILSSIVYLLGSTPISYIMSLFGLCIIGLTIKKIIN